MYADQIHKYIKKDVIAREHFTGVFASDKLPKITHYPISCVINTDPSSLPGQHWIAFYIDNKKMCSFFDSYGKKPSFYGIDQYLKYFSNNIEFNNSQLQGLDSSSCGYYCIYFVILKSRGLTLENITSVFSNKNFRFNDILIEKLIKELN